MGGQITERHEAVFLHAKVDEGCLVALVDARELGEVDVADEFLGVSPLDQKFDELLVLDKGYTDFF